MVGSLLGSRAAVRLMLAQPLAPEPVYHIFNCGFSKWGAKVGRGLTVSSHAQGGELGAEWARHRPLWL